MADILWNPPNGANCSACPFAKNGRPPHQPVLGEGRVDAVGVLVGEGPGKDEVGQNRPFVGPTGQELNQVLLDAGLARHKLFVLNATCCKPPPNKNDAMMRSAVRACSGYFKTAMPPKVPVLTMGKHAWEAFVGKIPKGGVNKGRGFLRQFEGRPYIATWHPTYAIFYNPYEWGAFDTDVKRFARMINGTLRPGPSELKPNAKAHDIKSLLQDGYPIAVDLETAPSVRSRPWTGKDATQAHIRTVGLGNVDRGISFLFDEMDIGMEKLFRKLLIEEVTIWQNGIWFDHRILQRYGFQIGKFYDTRDARMALSPTSPLNLGYMASLYDDCTPWKQDEEDGEKGLVFTDDMTKLQIYNAQDCVEQARVWQGIWNEPEFQTPRVQKLYEVQVKLSTIAARMHTRGIKVSKIRRSRLSRFCANEHARRLKKLIDHVGIPAFRGTPNDLRALIYKSRATPEISRFNLPDPWDEESYTEHGEIKVDQRTLLILMTQPSCPPELREIVDLYWQAYAPRKAASTFVDSDLIEQAIGPDGKLRPGWNSCGTDTGRFSCSQPNVMNLSREKD